MAVNQACAGSGWVSARPFLLVTVALMACGSVESASAPTSSALPAVTGAAAHTMGLGQGTQGQFESIRIGLVSIDRESGRLVGWLSSGPGAPFAVHVGETVTRSGYSIFVSEMSVGGLLDSLLCNGRVGCSAGSSILLVVSRASN